MPKAKTTNSTDNKKLRALARSQFNKWQPHPEVEKRGGAFTTKAAIVDRFNIASMAYSIMTKNKTELIALVEADATSDTNAFVELFDAFQGAAKDFDGIAQMLRSADARLSVAYAAVALREIKRRAA